MTDRTHELNGFAETFHEHRRFDLEEPTRTVQEVIDDILIHRMRKTMVSQQYDAFVDFCYRVTGPHIRFPRDPHKHKRMVAHRDYCENCGDVIIHDSDQGCNDFIAEMTEQCKEESR